LPLFADKGALLLLLGTRIMTLLSLDCNGGRDGGRDGRRGLVGVTFAMVVVVE
jgi:hypothetical protein